MEHTPGPWSQHAEFADRIVVNGSCVYQVRDLTTSNWFVGNGMGQPNPADVALMAAAPELAEALELAVALLSDYSGGEAIDLPSLRAVIAKAAGRGD